ncbi:hypothetical protein MNV49_007765, partial [Pseudohyphozyma bogoriensis]
MPRTLIAHSFSPASGSASLNLENPEGNAFAVHAVTDSVVRVVHTPPEKHQKKVNGEGVVFEESHVGDVKETNGSFKLTTKSLTIDVDLSEGCPRLSWFRNDGSEAASDSFLADCKTRAYCWDAKTGAVTHYVEVENWLPVDEDEYTALKDGEVWTHPERNEFTYGFGESRGTMEKSGKRFTMEGRDGLNYSWTEGDPLYKLSPFYTVYNKKTRKWFGVYYNSLADSVFDMATEHDVLFGCFKSYKAASGPLDYYVLTGDGTLPSILTEYASLLSPSTSSGSFAASPVLPPLSQFGYLSSSLALAADPKAQEAVIGFLNDSRKEGFPVDGLYLSSGWCQAEDTDDRNYFSWNLSRYPTPAEFGRIVETDLEVQVIVNIKPWLLDVHPMVDSAEQVKAFVGAAEEDEVRGDRTRSTEGGSAKMLVWGSGFASHKLGRYFDFSSKAGSKWWKDAIVEQLINKGLTGMWIDNNEMAGMVDDDATFAGEIGMYDAFGGEVGANVEKRAGWNGGKTTVGSVGKAINTMGMARATYEAVLTARPDDRPVIVSRSGVPGIQAYAHASWSGDNSTTWQALKYGTKMTLSVGLSFGPGLYGHDIGGFAGKHHPSPELLVRWCQNGAWHSRFTVHSWKEISTTMWMYNDTPEITKILQDVLALRYRLAPTFYSFYVSHYHRRAWPLHKPLLWYHSDDINTLKLDEEFIFGDKVLVAPVTEKGATTRVVYLPAIANDGEEGLEWCELDTGKWHKGEGFKTF